MSSALLGFPSLHLPCSLCSYLTPPRPPAPRVLLSLCPVPSVDPLAQLCPPPEGVSRLCSHGSERPVIEGPFPQEPRRCYFLKCINKGNTTRDTLGLRPFLSVFSTSAFTPEGKHPLDFTKATDRNSVTVYIYIESFSPPGPVCFKSPKKPSEECRLEKEKPTPYLQKGPSPQKNTGRKNGGRFTILTQSAGKLENHLENLVTIFPLMFKTLLIKRRSHISHLHILEVTATSFGRPSRFAMDFRYRVRSHKNNFDNLPEAPHR